MALQELRKHTPRSAQGVRRAERFTVAGHKLRMVALPAAYMWQTCRKLADGHTCLRHDSRI